MGIGHMDVLVVDDHPVVVSGCRMMFAQRDGIEVHAAADEKSGYEAYFEKRPDVAIVDINLPELSGFELLRKILRRDPDARIIMFSMNEDPAFAARALELGAKGFLTKNDDPGLLVEAVMKVAAGENFVTRQLAESLTFSSVAVRANPASLLTQRELEILRQLARGNTIDEVAAILNVSYKTIANGTSRLKQKLGAKNHADLVRIAVDMQMT
jgi:DNA-binding NarL/FixJ family response regulator